MERGTSLGLFDTVCLMDGTREKLLCHYKHIIPGTFQTKDLSRGLSTYVIYKDRLYVESGNYLDKEIKETVVSASDAEITLQALRTLTFVPHAGVVTIYTGCETCSGLAAHLMTLTAIPKVASDWVEYELTFEQGILKKYMLVATEGI